jgi:GNAT superfamily N-acetyltransferase
MSQDDHRIEVGIATPDERREALGLVLASAPPNAHGAILDSAGRAGGALGAFDALAVARSGGRVVAAAWAQPQPGGGASLWPPAGSGCAAAVVEQLMQAVNDVLDGRHGQPAIAMTQALFELDDDPRIVVVQRHGYRRIAELLYLGRTVPPHQPRGSIDPAGVLFEPYASDEERLHRVVKATYIESLDCPAIDGLRPVGEVLAGYRATGRFDPELWRLAVVDGRDAGVVIVAPHDDSDQAELVYMGLAPWARGRGRGQALIGEALRLTAFLGADLLMAAVDAANIPARRAYEATGFAPWSRRLVFVRTPPAGVAVSSEATAPDP